MRTDPTPFDPSNPSVDWEALARYLAGESSPAESVHISRWLEEHKADAELLRSLDNAMATLALRDAPNLDVEAALSRVAARRDAAEPAPEILPIRLTRVDDRSQRRAAVWRAATFLAAAAAVVVAARLVLHRNESASSSSAPALGAGALTFASAVGKRDSVRLPDGSRVILGPSSQLIVAAGYGQRVRELELHGEAYFDVLHDTTRPFIVHSGSAVIRDIGTTFAVRGDNGTRVQVVVTSGSVQLQSGDVSDSATLLAGDIATIEPGGRISTQHGATAPYLAWMRDSLVFREAPLAEVSSDLRRWYGVVLRVEDTALAKQHLTMTFSGDSLDLVLRVIALNLGRAEIERRGDTAIVRPSTGGARTQ